MDEFENSLNTLILRTYRSLEKLEEELLRKSTDFDLSMSEVHMLEAVLEEGSDETGGGRIGEEGATISELSEYLEISLPSVTQSVTKLASKGFVRKQKSEADGRVVLVKLTREGRRAARAHQYFHRRMVRAVACELTDEDKRALLRGVGKLDDFLQRNIQYYKYQQGRNK